MRGVYPPPTSSLGKSVSSGMPAFAAPPEPQSEYIQGGNAWVQNVSPATSTGRDGSAVVMRKPRVNGMRFLYQQAAYTKPWFRMKATGQVESSKFQPTTQTTYFDAFNDALHEAGWPRNMGLSFKVATIPPEALGTSPSQMAPKPRYTKSIYTNRNYGTRPALPAKPAAGVHR